MALLTNGIDPENLRNTYIFIDTNFLSLINSDPDALRDVIELCKFGYLLIDPIVRIEFLRDTFVPKIRNLRTKFINNAVFSPVTESHLIFEKVRDNALALSFLYAHKGFKAASVPDLLLAGRMILF